ncbi:MAG: hypothetical protein JWN94_3151 [Betaproteobacteria bacterium]|nr:hypothetical protein [Betaproteobacteria bacterium]
MIDFLKENWEIVFSGLGTAVIAALLAYFSRQRKGADAKSLHQDAKAGKGSQIVQVGGDANVGNFRQD